MPVPLLAEGFNRGLSGIPYAWTILKSLPYLFILYLLKLYFSGAKNTSERVLHGKVVMITVSLAFTRPLNTSTNTRRAEHQASAPP
jgi:DMSO/TMAO reductase YedYZ heme-binding membrane subunit